MEVAGEVDATAEWEVKKGGGGNSKGGPVRLPRGRRAEFVDGVRELVMGEEMQDRESGQAWRRGRRKKRGGRTMIEVG